MPTRSYEDKAMCICFKLRHQKHQAFKLTRSWVYNKIKKLWSYERLLAWLKSWSQVAKKHPNKHLWGKRKYMTYHLYEFKVLQDNFCFQFLESHMRAYLAKHKNKVVQIGDFTQSNAIKLRKIWRTADPALTGTTTSMK